MQKISNVKIFIKSWDHLSNFLLKHARTKYFPSVQWVESLFEWRILNYKCQYQNFLMIIDLKIWNLSLNFTRIPYIKYAEKRPLHFFPYNKETLKLYCLKKSKSSVCFGSAGGKKILFKYLSFVMPAFVCVYRTLTPVQSLVYKYQWHRGYNCNLLKGNSKLAGKM